MSLKIVQFGLPGPGEVCLERLLRAGAPPELFVLPPAGGDDVTALIRFLEQVGVPYLAPASREALSGEGIQKKIAALKPDLIVVTGYDALVPESLLSIPAQGAINFHPAILPKYRGQNPYFWVIANGDAETGVTAHYMDNRFDTGDVIAMRTIPVLPMDTMGIVFLQLAHAAADLLEEVLAEVQADCVARHPQPQGDFVKAPRVTEEHLRLDPLRPAVSLERLVRAANPFFGAHLTVGGISIRVWEAEVLPETRLAAPGTIVRSDEGWALVTVEGLLRPRVIQVGIEAILTAERLTERLIEKGILAD